MKRKNNIMDEDYISKWAYCYKISYLLDIVSLEYATQLVSNPKAEHSSKLNQKVHLQRKNHKMLAARKSPSRRVGIVPDFLIVSYCSLF